jgi:hypothetical protein
MPLDLFCVLFLFGLSMRLTWTQLWKGGNDAKRNRQ